VVGRVVFGWVWTSVSLLVAIAALETDGAEQFGPLRWAALISVPFGPLLIADGYNRLKRRKSLRKLHRDDGSIVFEWTELDSSTQRSPMDPTDKWDVEDGLGAEGDGGD